MYVILNNIVMVCFILEYQFLFEKLVVNVRLYYVWEMGIISWIGW